MLDRVELLPSVKHVVLIAFDYLGALLYKL
jgi:hypothetical protein